MPGSWRFRIANAAPIRGRSDVSQHALDRPRSITSFPADLLTARLGRRGSFDQPTGPAAARLRIGRYRNGCPSTVLYVRHRSR